MRQDDSGDGSRCGAARDCHNGAVSPPAAEPLPDDVATLKAMLLAERQAHRAEVHDQALLIEKLEHQIARLRHERFGQSSERRALLDQLELQLFELKEDQAQAEAAMPVDEPSTQAVQAFTRRKPARRPLPEHLPRERVVHPAPSACPCCGGTPHKLGEGVTEMLELVPRHWKVIQHVREKFSCRNCEKITQPPAPAHPIARGRAGPGLLAHLLFGKYGLHLPLTRQSATYAREGVPLDVSTLADWVGASAATLMPLVEAIRAHVFAAERIHADETTVPVLDPLASLRAGIGKTRTGRLWTYVRDDRPFAGTDPPAAAYFYSPDRGGVHSEAAPGLLRRADARRRLCRLQPPVRGRPQARADRPGGVLGPCTAQVLRPGPAQQGAVRHRGGDSHRCPVRHRARDRRQAAVRAPACAAGAQPAAGRGARDLAARAVRQILPGRPGRQGDRLQPQPLGQPGPLPRRWPPVHDHNAAERTLRGIAIGRHNWTFAGSDNGGRRAATIYTLIETAKLNDIGPQTWLADMLARLQDHPAKRIAELLPWNWKRQLPQRAAA
jgi:transposase